MFQYTIKEIVSNAFRLAMPIVLLLAISLLSVNCRDYSSEKADANNLATKGEWVVKETDYDRAPSDGTTGVSPCSVRCSDGESKKSGFNIEVGNSAEKKGEKFCVHPSHPDFGDFVRLKRGERVRFAYVEDAVQENCSGPAMFVRLVL